MQTNDHKIVDYILALDKKFGKEGTQKLPWAEVSALFYFVQTSVCMRRSHTF